MMQPPKTKSKAARTQLHSCRSEASSYPTSTRVPSPISPIRRPSRRLGWASRFSNARLRWYGDILSGAERQVYGSRTTRGGFNDIVNAGHNYLRHHGFEWVKQVLAAHLTQPSAALTEAVERLCLLNPLLGGGRTHASSRCASTSTRATHHSLNCIRNGHPTHPHPTLTPPLLASSLTTDRTTITTRRWHPPPSLAALRI